MLDVVVVNMKNEVIVDKDLSNIIIADKIYYKEMKEIVDRISKKPQK